MRSTHGLCVACYLTEERKLIPIAVLKLFRSALFKNKTLTNVPLWENNQQYGAVIHPDMKYYFYMTANANNDLFYLLMDDAYILKLLFKQVIRITFRVGEHPRSKLVPVVIYAIQLFCF